MHTPVNNKKSPGPALAKSPGSLYRTGIEKDSRNKDAPFVFANLLITVPGGIIH
jgi:hypothetical protein